MCGICGILRVWPAGEPPPPVHESIPEAWLNVLDESVRHRGPDGQGRFRQRVVRADGATVDVALVHRRLSIIDHAGGGQPMLLGGELTTEAQRAQSTIGKGDADSEGGIGAGARAAGTGPLLWMAGPQARAPGGLGEYSLVRAHVCPRCGPLAVVFNGCIYNHRELRRELHALGHEFHSDHSDTEVLLHGWGEWGRRLPGKLDGMFAALIWDGRAASLHALRDVPGEKPLYDTVLRTAEGTSRAAIFGSSAGGLTRLAARVGAARPRPEREFILEDWIGQGWAARDESAVEGVQEFWSSAPGSTPHGSVPPVVVERDDLSRIPERTQGAALTPDDVDVMLSKAVESRLEADVPLACFLSGGIDSALIAAYARRTLGTLSTFTVRMAAAGFDESNEAADTARHLGVAHSILDCRADPGTDLPSLIEQLGLPFGDSSLLPTSWISRAVRSEVRVALAGDGGDELFGGYQRYTIASDLARWRGVLRLVPTGLVPSRGARSKPALVRRIAHAAQSDGYPDLVRIFPRAMLGALVGRSAGRVVAEGRRIDPLRHDFLTYLRGDILRKTDSASMGVGLEVRSPFLSRDLIHACLSAPLSNLMPGGERKGLLRQVARKYFPAEIVDRPKQGFAIPIGEWFRSDYGGMRHLLYDHLEGPDPFPGLPFDINMKFVRRLLREHDAAGERSLNPWHGRDHSQRLYMLLVLSIWAKWLARL